MKHRVLEKVNGRLILKVSAKERGRLQAVRDRHELPYLRERVGAILKLAAGASVPEVARHGLLKPRKADTVYHWLARYVVQGVAGLFQRPRRSSSPLTEQEQAQLAEAIFEKTPEEYALACSRWSLQLLRQALGFLQRRYRANNRPRVAGPGSFACWAARSAASDEPGGYSRVGTDAPASVPTDGR